jgi:hypothetical protein
VIKDGIGQLGGVLFASYLGTFRGFDSDPKRWRMVSSFSMDAATALEILTPMLVAPAMFPGSFLLVAGIANVGKNVSYLSASASRAAIHASLCASSNLADVTAKSGSQSILASMAGTAVGVGLSPLIGADPPKIFASFLVLSAFQQTCNYLSLTSLQLRTLNPQRAGLLVEGFLERGETPSRGEVAAGERFVWGGGGVRSGSRWERGGRSCAAWTGGGWGR